MSDVVRWGILGPGGIATRFANEFRGADGVELVAVGSRDAQRARAFADANGIPAAYGSYDEVVSDSAVDIVYISTPHRFHYEHAMLAMSHGKAVLVEKPFVMNSAEGEQLVAEARRRGVLLMDGLWTLCNPLLIDLAERIRDGRIGTPTGFAANVGPLGIPFPRAGTRLEDRDQGASFLLECHVYPLAVMLALVPDFHDVVELTAAATFAPNHIDELASILLKTASGYVGSITGGFVFDSPPGPDSKVVVTGSSGWLEIQEDVFNPRRARIGNSDGIEQFDSDAADRGFAWEIEEASRAHRAGLIESPLVPHSLSLSVMRLLDRARTSAGITVGG